MASLSYKNPDTGEFEPVTIAVEGLQTEIARATAAEATKVAKGELAINVDDYISGGATDHRAAWVAAISAAKTTGARRIIAPRRAGYDVSGPYIDLGGLNNVTIEGNGMFATEIRPIGSLDGLFGASSACSKVTFRNIAAIGSAVDDVTAPRRSRTFGSNTFNAFVILQGDLVPGSSNPVIRDITFDSVRVYGSAALPILLRGIRGTAKIVNSRFENTMDVGWTHCESAVCIGNESFKSADNGFSISRGCKRAVVTGNTVDLCAYYGVWVAGFIVDGSAADKGPLNFSVIGNTITNSGRGGIQANDAPKYGVISGNHIDTVYRGATDGPSNLAGVGIVVGGFPSNDQPNPTDYAESILVVGNTIRAAARGGVLVRGAKNIAVRTNLIVDPGSQYLADGTTAITSSDTTSNFGIAVENPTTVTNLSVRNNAIMDSRSTPYLNYGWFLTGSVNPDYSNNFASANARQLLTTDNTNDSIGGTKSFSGNTKHSGGATAGANAATGTVTGYDINGAAGSTRPFRVLTAGVARWHIEGDSTAEGGSNAGSNLLIKSRDDAGAFLSTVLSANRATGEVSIPVLSAPSMVPDYLFASGGEAPISMFSAKENTVAQGTGSLKLVYFTAKRSETINNLSIHTGSAGWTTATLLRLGVYSIAANGDGTLVASSASDPTTGPPTSANITLTRALSAPWAKQAGQRYALALIVVGSGTANLVGAFLGHSDWATVSGTRYVASLASQTDLPASFTAASLTTSANAPQFLALP